MTRTIAFSIALMFVLPSGGLAQAVPSPGDRIRIKQVDGTVLTGTLATLSTEAVQLSVGTDRADVPVERIDVLETSLGLHRNVGKYIGWTVGIGAIVGAAYGGINWEASNSSSSFSGLNTVGMNIVAGFFAGALIGLPVGVIIGLGSDYEEQWNRVPIPRPRLTIRPVIGSRLGFGASVRLGG